ncbi:MULTISPECIES: hypothetical protein [unclassified Streptomyces]|uniref:hypothetical protein n=1 Tax=unclassified Streptomyces TaxID=2593676 RepID=UPI000A62F83D|nr:MULTISPECIES: hypothetical protein [unclassified Streptomyces]
MDGSADVFRLRTGPGLAVLGIALAVLAVSAVLSPAVTGLGHRSPVSFQRRTASVGR